MRRDAGYCAPTTADSTDNMENENVTKRCQAFGGFALVTIIACFVVGATDYVNAQTTIPLTITQSSTQIPGTRGTGSGGSSCPDTTINTSASFSVTLPSQYASIAQALADGYFFSATGTGQGSVVTYQNGSACTFSPGSVGPEDYFVTFSQNEVSTEGIPSNIGIAAVAPSGTAWTITPRSISYSGVYIQPSSLCVLTCQVGNISFSISGDIGSVCSSSSLGLPNSLYAYAALPPSKDGKNTVMAAWFNPTLGGTYSSLSEAAAACGYSEFNWQQIITYFPVPNPLSLCFSSGTNECFATNLNPQLPLFTSPPGPPVGPPPASAPWNDPPKSGYTYFNKPGDWSMFTNPDAYPFYFNFPFALSSPFATATTLFFKDQPNYAFLITVPDEYMGFTTRLVGIKTSSTSANPQYDVLGTFDWISTYTGATINTGEALCLTGCQTASTIPDGGGGIGGVTITSVNGVSQKPPTTVCAASPSTLWPPNGKSAPVTISGKVSTGTSPLIGGSFSVIDSYGQDQPNGILGLAADGSYSISLPLIASRNGDDMNGRMYTIYVRGQDGIGNVGVCSAVVTVPHDQGN